MLTAGFTDDELGVRGRANLTTANDMIEVFAGVAAEPRYGPLLVAMRNSMRNVRIPLRLDDDLFVPHKTGSLAGLVNDAGIAYGRHVDLAVAFLTDQQPDTARTSTDIGDCLAAIRAAVGEGRPDEMSRPGTAAIRRSADTSLWHSHGRGRR